MWKEIAEKLGFSDEEVHTLEKKQVNPMALVIEIWVKNDKSSCYTPNWRGFYELLKAVKRKDLANKLKVATNSMCSDVHGNFYDRKYKVARSCRHIFLESSMHTSCML